MPWIQRTDSNGPTSCPVRTPQTHHGFSAPTAPGGPWGTSPLPSFGMRDLTSVSRGLEPGCRPEPALTRPLLAAVTGSGTGSRPRRSCQTPRGFCLGFRDQGPRSFLVSNSKGQVLLSHHCHQGESASERSQRGAARRWERGRLLGREERRSPSRLRCSLAVSERVSVPDFCFSGNQGSARSSPKLSPTSLLLTSP